MVTFPSDKLNPGMETFRHSHAVGFRAMAPNDLAGLAEVATICEVSKRTAQTYTARPDFPAPLDRLAAGPVWRRRDVERWATKHLPIKTGRPPKH